MDQENYTFDVIVGDQDNNERGKEKEPSHKRTGDMKKHGVCYLSRIPPSMTPMHVRHILSKHGEVERIYLVPEGGAGQVPQKKGGRTRGEFSEGWVEFAKRSVAKRVANLLNGEQIGGRRRSPFYYDIWNIKYLRKFKWDDLVSETAERSHIRKQKLHMEISTAKRQRDHYLSKIEKSHALKFIQERRKKKQKTESTEAGNGHTKPNIGSKNALRWLNEEADDSRKKATISRDILAGIFAGSSSS